MKKKSIFLALILMILFLLSGTVNAQTEYTLEDYHYTNPVYKDIEINQHSEAIQPYSLNTADEVYTSDVQKIAEKFRQELVERDSVIDVYYYSSDSITQNFFDALANQLFQNAISHTGVGNEGDYLKWHYQGWTAEASYTFDANGGYDLHITYYMSYLSDAGQEKQVTEKVDDLLQSFNLSGKTDYEKIKAIYDYICDNITYDYKTLDDDTYTLKYTAYAALINKTAVCQGYASLFYRMVLDAGVDARVISGDAGGPHAWNIVSIDGKYYNLDSTWDAGNDSYAYFLKNMADFSDHVRDEEYADASFEEAYPISEESYYESDDVEQFGDYEYVINNNQIMITRYTGDDQNVVIPAEIDNKPVAVIGPFAFDSAQTLEILEIPEGVETVEVGAFWDCTNLRKVYFPHSVTSIENYAFYNAVNLVDIYYAGTQEEWEQIPKDGAFDDLTPIYHFNYDNEGKGQWIQSGSRWWYQYADGSYPASERIQIDGTWYGFDHSGWMETGWALHENTWYYFSAGGAMCIGWVLDGNTWYYMDENGKMIVGWQQVNGAWYYFGESGAMRTGWVLDGSKWYYMNENGVMQTGWQQVNDIWYYFGEGGSMVTGWQEIGDTWYYFDSNGQMASDAWIGNWYVDGSGAWVSSR